MEHVKRDEALDDVEGALCDRLLAQAGRAGALEGDLHERIRALVDREAGLLDDDARARLWRASPSARFEVMVIGPAQIWSSATGASSRRSRAPAARLICAARSSLLATRVIVSPSGRSGKIRRSSGVRLRLRPVLVNDGPVTLLIEI